MINKTVIKRDGTTQGFDLNRIVSAIRKAGGNQFISELVAEEVNEKINNGEIECSVEAIEQTVVSTLIDMNNKTVAISYEGYRAVQEYKRNMELRQDFDDILNKPNRENANKNSYLISAKKGHILDAFIQEEMLSHVLPRKLAEAHKDNQIKFHDLSDRYFGGINCCLFDMKSVIENNPVINGLKYDDADSIEAYLGILSDVLLEASSQQYGGFTINEIDHVLEDVLELSYQKSIQYYKNILGDKVTEETIEELATKFIERAFRKRWNGIETRLNSISNSNMQVPFETISLGNRTTKWARFVTRIILETRLKGCGKLGQTAIFPKIVFFYRDKIHGEGGVNEDLYNLAIECRAKRNYPDMLSLDAGWSGDMWKKYGFALAPMGCRAYLSPYFNEKGDAVFNGRANCGAITINTVRPALMFRKTQDKEAYFTELKKYFDLATEGHLWQFERMKNIKASSNPLFFCSGGCHIKLNEDDTIEKAIRTFTWSYGYIGLNEASILMTGKEIHEDNSFAIEVLEHMVKWKDEAIKEHGLMFAIYGTPAEKYCETCRDKEYKHFGEIPRITDKKYFMNSFHTNVTAKVDPFTKMEIEKPMFDLSYGGHIFYSEYPINHNLEAISQVTKHAMKMGLYEGINFDSAICENCGKEILDYDKTNPVCTHCGSHKIIVTDRVCGYLSYFVIDGDTRANEGKVQEDQQREVHYGHEVERGINDFEILDGDGLRVSVWFTGCPHHCEDCHNQYLWKHDEQFKLNQDKVIELCKERKRLSILGGEPFAPYNRNELLELLQKVRQEVPECSIYVWTGYEYDNVKDLPHIKYIDKLICGKYEKDKKCDNPMYGSSNQYIVDLNK